METTLIVTVSISSNINTMVTMIENEWTDKALNKLSWRRGRKQGKETCSLSLFLLFCLFHSGVFFTTRFVVGGLSTFTYSEMSPIFVGLDIAESDIFWSKLDEIMAMIFFGHKT